MFETILLKITAIFTAIPFTAATWAVIFTMGMFIWLFAKASRDPKSPVKWEHLIIDSSNDRASPYKLGFLLGGMIATWIVVKQADGDKLQPETLVIYLTYLLGGSSVNVFAKLKGSEPPPDAPRASDPKLTADSMRGNGSSTE